MKRSIMIAGHATSLSLEPEFWDALKEIAVARGLSLAALVGELDEAREAEIMAGNRADNGTHATKPRNLSAYLRVYVLGWIRQGARR